VPTSVAMRGVLPAPESLRSGGGGPRRNSWFALPLEDNGALRGEDEATVRRHVTTNDRIPVLSPSANHELLVGKRENQGGGIGFRASLKVEVSSRRPCCPLQRAQSEERELFRVEDVEGGR